MELEKALFRIHERILSQEHVQQAVRIVKLGFSALGLFMLCVFFYANSAHRNVQGCVGQIYNEFKDKQLEGKNLANDTVIFINVCNYNKTVQPEPMSYFNYTFYDPPVSDGKNGTADSTDLDPNTLKDGNDKDTIIGDGDNNSKDPSNINNDVDPVDKTNQTYQLPSYINPKKKQLKSHCTELPRIQMEQAGISQTLYYPKELRAVRNITTAVMYIEPHCFASNSFADKIIYNVIGIEPVLINEIITNFRYGDLYMKNLLTDESWSWTTLQIISYTDDQISNFIYSFIRINLGLFYTSAVSSLYIKISIICSPVFILLIMYCVKCMGSQDVNITTLIQTFPYLGLYLHALRGQKTNELVKAFMKMMLVIYFVYLSALFIGSLILFHKSIPKGLDENFLALLAVLELLIMLFIRTRSSLKWFPRVCILLMSTFLYYTQNTIYGFYSALLQVIVFFIIAYFCMILEEFEIPGVTWNESYHYTPSTHRPRVLYFPIFNLGWYYDLPQLWTMFYPMYGRDHFTQAQLSLVDSNYILLNQTLENAERANNNDLGILIDFPQNRNNNNNNNNNENNDNNNNNNNNNDQNNGGGQVGNENQEEGDNHHQDRQQNQDIEMQGGSLDNRRQQNAQTNQISQNQASDDFFSEENQNRSREQHLLTQEERALGNSQNSAEASGFYQGRGVMIGGGSSQAPYRSNNEDTSSGTKIGKDLTEYQKLE